MATPRPLSARCRRRQAYNHLERLIGTRPVRAAALGLPSGVRTTAVGRRRGTGGGTATARRLARYREAQTQPAGAWGGREGA